MMIKNKKDPFFLQLEAGTELVLKIADLTAKALSDISYQKQWDIALSLLQTLREKECSYNRALLKTFLPPLAREDLLLLFQRLCREGEALEMILLQLYVRETGPPPKRAVILADPLLYCYTAQLTAIRNLSEPVSPSSITAWKEKAHTFHLLFAKALHSLYAEDTSLSERLFLTELFHSLHAAVWECLKTADTLEWILLKNT